MSTTLHHITPEEKLWITDILNTNASDYLKALVLNQTTTLSLELAKIKTPPGMAERAFAEAATTKKAEPEPHDLKQIACRHPKKKQSSATSITEPEPPKQLKPLPDSLRYTDMTNADLKKEMAEKAKKNTNFPDDDNKAGREFLIEGEVYVDCDRAAAIRSIKLRSVYAIAGIKSWRRHKHPDTPRRVVFLKEDVKK